MAGELVSLELRIVPLFTGTLNTHEMIAGCNGCGRAVCVPAGIMPAAAALWWLCRRCDPLNRDVTAAERACAEALRTLIFFGGEL